MMTTPILNEGAAAATVVKDIAEVTGNQLLKDDLSGLVDSLELAILTEVLMYEGLAMFALVDRFLHLEEPFGSLTDRVEV